MKPPALKSKPPGHSDRCPRDLDAAVAALADAEAVFARATEACDAAHDHFDQRNREHSAAVAVFDGAEAAFTRATEAYDAALGQGREVALEARRAQGDAEVDRDIARRFVDTAAAQRETARAAMAAAEAGRLSAAALARIAEFQSVALRDYREVILSVRRMARLWANAEIARDEAIQGGVSEFDLPSVEGFRDVPALPRKLIETKRVSWPVCPRTDNPRPAMEQGNDYVPAGPTAGDRIVSFDKNIVLKAERGSRAKSLMETLMVPGLIADDVVGWTPPPHLSARQVLAHLDALEGAAAPDRTDRRSRDVELQRVAE